MPSDPRTLLVSSLVLSLSLLGAPTARAARQEAPARRGAEPENPAGLSEPVLPTAPAALTLPEALRLFRAHGLDLLIADNAIALARADHLLAGALPNPSLTISVGGAFGYSVGADACAGCSPLALGVGIGDNGLLGELLSGRRGLRRRVASAAVAAAQLSRADAERTLVFQVKQLYAQVALGQRLVDFSREVQESAAKTLDLNRVRYRAGAISEAIVARVEVDKLTADQNHDSASQALRQAQVGLAFLLGLRRAVPSFLVGAEPLRYAAPAAPLAEESEALLRRAIESRPDLRAAAVQQSRAESAVALAQRLNVPDLALGLGYQGQGTGSNAIQPPTLTGSLTITPPLLNQHRGERERAQAELRQAALQHQRLRAQVVADVENARAAFLASQRRVLRSERELLGRARRARDLIALQYEKGAASLLEYLDAQRTYIANNMDYFNNLEIYWTALFQLEQAVGTELGS